MRLKTIIILLLSLLIAMISIQNAATIDLRFFTWEFSISRILLILISFVIGILVGFLLSLKRKVKG